MKYIYDNHVSEHGKKLLLDSYVSYTGDDIAIVITHKRGPSDAEIHKLCWDAFMAGTEVAKSQGLHGAAMLPMSELECTGIVEKLKSLDKRLTVRA